MYCYPLVEPPKNTRETKWENISYVSQLTSVVCLHFWNISCFVLLGGYYNDKPVYQHVSGLDFLYYHQNNVWGVGPKIGGNSAGLLNFGRNSCPYELVTPWEFGTKLKNQKRQMDPQLSLR